MKRFDFSPQQISRYQDRIISAFRLARKAGKCILGTETCVLSIRENKAKLVICANDISQNTKKKIMDASSFHNVECLFLDIDKISLGENFGKSSGISCAAITDNGFIKIIEKIYSEIHTQHTEVQQYGIESKT